jgi:hypothetical protein
MKTLAEELEEMRVRMHDLATNEQDLVTALGEALNNADNKLLDDLRNLSSEHEARRTAIVQELQRLAGRLGALPAAGDFLEALGAGSSKLPPFESSHHGTGGHTRSGASFAEELTKHLAGGRPGGH